MYVKEQFHKETVSQLHKFPAPRNFLNGPAGIYTNFLKPVTIYSITARAGHEQRL